jgi:hypothetical protein
MIWLEDGDLWSKKRIVCRDEIKREQLERIKLELRQRVICCGKHYYFDDGKKKESSYEIYGKDYNGDPTKLNYDFSKAIIYGKNESTFTTTQVSYFRYECKQTINVINDVNKNQDLYMNLALLFGNTENFDVYMRMVNLFLKDPELFNILIENNFPDFQSFLRCIPNIEFDEVRTYNDSELMKEVRSESKVYEIKMSSKKNSKIIDIADLINRNYNI